MKNISKICKRCGVEFFKKHFESRKYWETKKFCSVSCSLIGRPSKLKGRKNLSAIGNKYSQGLIPWNKGFTTKTNPIIKAYGKKSGDSRRNKPRTESRIIGRYRHIFSPHHPRTNSVKTVPEHVLVMEKHLGRYLTKEEIVHHINRDRLDNRIENLQLFESNSAHMKYHALHDKNSGLKKGQQKGRIVSKETRLKISNTLKSNYGLRALSKYQTQE